MRSSALPLLLALGCGDGVVGQDYLGTPLFGVRGAVVAAEAAAPEDPRLSLFWIGYDSRAQQRQVVEQRIAVDAAFARFDLAIFDTPPPAALAFDGAGVALIVVYADNNENDLLNSDVRAPVEGPDTILGASRGHLVVYASERLTGEGRGGAFLGPLAPGYHLFESDDASCRFEAAAHCVGVGAIRRVAPETDITIRLEATPSQVMVPNPAVPGLPGSGTQPGDNGSLYGP